MRDLKSEIDRWVKDNNFKGVKNGVSKHKTDGGSSRDMSGNSNQVVQSRNTDVLSDRV